MTSVWLFRIARALDRLTSLVVVGTMVLSATTGPPMLAAQSVQPLQPVQSVQSVGDRTPTSPATIPIKTPITITNKKVSAASQRKAARLYMQGAKAIEANDPRTAGKLFEEAARLDPENGDYATASAVARQHIITLLIQESARQRLMGHEDISRASLAEALKLDPDNPYVAQHIDLLAANYGARVGSRDVSTELVAEPIQLDPQTALHSFHLRATQAELIRQALSAYGISASFDESVKAVTTRLDVDDLPYGKTAEMLRLVTGTFFVPLDPRRVLVAADTKENRAKYQRLVLETVYLPGLTPNELTDMGNVARNVFEAPQATVQPQQSTLTVRAPEQTVKALNATLAGMLDGRSQIVLEIRLYQVNRTRAKNIGILLPQQTTLFNVSSEVNAIIANNQGLVNQLIASGQVQPGDILGIAALLVASGAASGSILSQPFALFGGGLTATGLTIPKASANLNFNSADSRVLDQVLLRLGDQEAGTLRSGTRYPIITSSFSNLTTAGLNIPGLTSPGLSSALQQLGVNLGGAGAQQQIPQIQYEDLGLTLKATPHIQRSQEVSLAVDLKIESLGGGSANGIPVLNNQQFQGNITVHEGDSVMLISDMNRQQSAAISGIPGLSELPGFHSTTNKSTQVDTSTLAILISPHVVRRQHNEFASPVVMLPQH